MTAPTNPPPERSGPVWPGYAVPSGSYTTTSLRHISHLRLLVILVVCLAVVAAVTTLIAHLLTPPPPNYHCPPNCPPPPTAPFKRPQPDQKGTTQATAEATHPVTAAAPIPVRSDTYRRWSPSDGSFSVEYFSPEISFGNGTQKTTVNQNNGVAITFDNNNPDLAGDVALYGQPAGNQTPQDIAEALVQAHYPGAKRAYAIPNAMVGYQPGYGEFDDFYPQASASSAVHKRVLVMVAVKNGLALVATASGNYVQFVSSGDPHPPRHSMAVDHPSAANLAVANVIGVLINSFAWKGDQPR
jgi:hypothetical protein